MAGGGGRTGRRRAAQVIRVMPCAAGAALCGGASAQVLSDNRPLLTNPNTCTAPPPGMISEVQLNNTTVGFGADASHDQRLADDFVVGDSAGWTVTGFCFYGYEFGQDAGSTQINGGNLRIWAGRPGDTGATVVAGDPTTNRLSGVMFAGIYRVGRTGINCGTDRAVFKLTCTIAPLNLLPGTYWVDWQISSPSTLSGPWVPPVTITGLAGKPGANAIGLIDPAAFIWAQAADGTSGVPQDLPFQVLGAVNGACYANCDHSTEVPVLNRSEERRVGKE